MPIIPKKSASMPSNDSGPKSLAVAYGAQRMAKKKMAYGGMAEGGEAEAHYDSIADAIMRKKKMADGGMVDIQENGEETPSTLSPFDDQNADAILKEMYDDEQLGSQPEDSNEMGDDIDSDDHDEDMISKIRKRNKSK